MSEKVEGEEQFISENGESSGKTAAVVMKWCEETKGYRGEEMPVQHIEN